MLHPCWMKQDQRLKSIKNKIDIVIMGAGIELEKRLEIVRYVFNTSNITSVHMKDRGSGPEGFIPFINKVLNGSLS